jgi:hypothetical protein
VGRGASGSSARVGETRDEEEGLGITGGFPEACAHAIKGKSRRQEQATAILPGAVSLNWSLPPLGALTNSIIVEILTALKARGIDG